MVCPFEMFMVVAPFRRRHLQAQLLVELESDVNDFPEVPDNGTFDISAEIFAHDLQKILDGILFLWLNLIIPMFEVPSTETTQDKLSGSDGPPLNR